jgi:hypothetical protein
VAVGRPRHIEDAGLEGAHRLSGLALAVFLPFHFWALG